MGTEKMPLAAAILKQEPTNPFSDPVHKKALRLFGEYVAIGGMLEGVELWWRTSYQECVEIHRDLLSTYRQDFEKYARETQIKVKHLFQQASHQLGEQFRFSKVAR